ncbi:hypothetical protein MYK68_01115 [Gordonia sp. PP30]|uniref:hypothetical protein n=1 Tax=Gordonia sp. PP30 TaxID=2935861 RepID=UPI001FFE63E5|nr:hypothetical protein [Gordonia sp. PP30]UQE75272.1 hypothetical protein MYK68_01115 [Gordonia sp. PP30]
MSGPGPADGIGGTDPVGELAARIAEAVRAVPGVAGLSGGSYGTIATYLPGRRVVGVRLGADEGEVAVIASLGHPLAELADRIRAAASSITGLPIDVLIADLDTPPDPDSGRRESERA